MRGDGSEIIDIGTHLHGEIEQITEASNQIYPVLSAPVSVVGSAAILADQC